MVDITLMNREKIKDRVEKDSFGKNSVVFCFYKDGEEQIDFGKTRAKGLCAKLEDIGCEEIRRRYNSSNEFFEEADIIAGAAIKAVAEGNEIILLHFTLGHISKANLISAIIGNNHKSLISM